MSSPQTFQLTSSGKEYIDRIIDILTPAFQDDPIYAWLLHHFPLSKHQTVLRKLFGSFFAQASLNGAIFVEVDGFGCCGVFMPPGASIVNPWTLLQAGLIPALFTIGPTTFKRAILDYGSRVEPMLHKTFTKEEQKSHWYVFIMGTATDRRRQGLASAMLEDLMERARNDKRPIWLEATTRESLQLYTRHGFETVGEMVLGRGDVGPDGLPCNGGPGVTIWSMFWRP
ncbi:hypothetical protein O1611_g5993 [Lasiodiplodia mahajangana]|uniref:Uncharacterized protein n=1 Tax=Lasiodiplodia mahajangana TaxID=1108764 RepID=A0ACC2JKB9_9PEZI|nr:hypothetical protein O1611_g5993 [Lasiodiplodia mahajangana]